MSINQLYHPTSKLGQDSQDLFYSSKILNTTKFTPILLKEWFYLIKKNGFLIVDYKPNNICDWQQLEEMMWWLWKGKYNVCFHRPITLKENKSNSKKELNEFIKNINNKDQLITQKEITNDKPLMRFVCQKNVSTLIPGDSIDKWTFGMITNGQRLDWLQEIINSIRNQKIPNYQIIICGEYPHDKKDKDIDYIHFTDRNDLGWITKKKNLIVKEAKYQNLCLLHDRIILDPTWYQGMKEWGNCFEILSCAQLLNNKRTYDYMTYEPGLFKPIPHLLALLDPKDWHNPAFQGGQLHIFKKQLFVDKNILFLETIYWGISEDVQLCYDFLKEGFLLRYNPSAKVNVKISNYINPPQIKFNNKKLSKLLQGHFFIIISRRIYALAMTLQTPWKIIKAVYKNYKKFCYNH